MDEVAFDNSNPKLRYDDIGHPELTSPEKSKKPGNIGRSIAWMYHNGELSFSDQPHSSMIADFQSSLSEIEFQDMLHNLWMGRMNFNTQVVTTHIFAKTPLPSELCQELINWYKTYAPGQEEPQAVIDFSSGKPNVIWQSSDFVMPDDDSIKALRADSCLPMYRYKFAAKEFSTKKYVIDDYSALIADTDRYTSDAYRIEALLRENKRGYSVAFRVYNEQLGITGWAEYWHYKNDEKKSASKTFKELKAITDTLAEEIEYNRPPMSNVIPMFRLGVKGIDVLHKEKSGIYHVNWYNVDVPVVDDWRRSIYGDRYPGHVIRSIQENWNDDDPSRKIQTKGKGSRNKQYSFKYAEADLSWILSAPGEDSRVGEEQGLPVVDGVSVYRDQFGSHRYVRYITGQAVAGLQVVINEQKAVVANVYVLPELRSQGLASQLFKQAQQDFPNIEHSQNVEPEGQDWINKLSHKVTEAGWRDWIGEENTKRVDAFVDKAFWTTLGFSGGVITSFLMWYAPQNVGSVPQSPEEMNQVAEIARADPQIQEKAEQFQQFAEAPEYEQSPAPQEEPQKPHNNKELPRGIRNNNPGNIELGKDAWQGMTEEQGDGRFIQFDSPEYGIRALAKLLRNYEIKYGLNTITGIISRWAPPSENDTKSYIQQVSSRTGFAPNQPLDLNDEQQLFGLVRAIIHHENGMSYYDDETIFRGIQLALGKEGSLTDVVQKYGMNWSVVSRELLDQGMSREKVASVSDSFLSSFNMFHKSAQKIASLS